MNKEKTAVIRFPRYIFKASQSRTHSKAVSKGRNSLEACMVILIEEPKALNEYSIFEVHLEGVK